jgi:hypothetical protein
MKNISLLLLSCSLLLNACKKKTDDKTTVTPTPASPYYFKATLDGTSYNLTGNTPQYILFYTNEAGGYQVGNASLLPSFGLRLMWAGDDTVKESDLMGLIGKTLYFSDSLIRPEVTYNTSLSAQDWMSENDSNPAYNVKISNVTFLKKDTSAGYYLSTYVIKGTCSALMSQGSATAQLTGGEFNFIISRRDL